MRFNWFTMLDCADSPTLLPPSRLAPMAQVGNADRCFSLRGRLPALRRGAHQAWLRARQRAFSVPPLSRRGYFQRRRRCSRRARWRKRAHVREPHPHLFGSSWRGRSRVLSGRRRRPPSSAEDAGCGREATGNFGALFVGDHGGANVRESGRLGPRYFLRRRR